MALPAEEERIRRKKIMKGLGMGVPNTDTSWGPWWDKQWKNAEIIKRKYLMQDSGIHVPNTDESWGPWWNKQWKKAITRIKDNNYYGVPSSWNIVRQAINKITGNTTYETEPQPRGGTMQATDMGIGAQVKRTLNNWQHFGDPLRDVVLTVLPSPDKPVVKATKVGKETIKLVPELIKSTPKLFTKEGAKAAGAKVAEATMREVPRAGVAFLLGKGVDGISEAITGKSWAENASEKMSNMAGFHIEPIFGEIINPGYSGGYKWVDRGIKRASFNHITPISYTDDVGLPLTKTQEFKALLGDIPKQLITFKPIETPAWRTRIENMPQYSRRGNNIFRLPISDSNFLNNREEAMRLVFGQPQKTPLYTKNNNGTYSYNLDYIESQGNPDLIKDGYIISPSGEVSNRYVYKPFKDEVGYGDVLGWNGGYINYKQKNGVSYISDVFDVQPFKDPDRIANIFNMGEFMHKYLPDFEVFSALGGKPFKLEMTLPTYQNPYPSF